MPLRRSTCSRFPGGYSRAVVDAHLDGTKPGTRRKAATREPGDLSTTPTITTPSGGRRMGDAMTLRLLCRTALVAALSLFATSAFAHHVMGGKTPSTFVEGLLSGVGHPVIGPDH